MIQDKLSDLSAKNKKPIKPTTPYKVLEMFGEQVKKERKKKGISQQQLAEYVKVSSDTIKRIESGNSTKLDVAYNIAEVLDVPFQILLPRQDMSQDELLEKIKEAQDTLQFLLEKLYDK